VATLLVI